MRKKTNGARNLRRRKKREPRNQMNLSAVKLKMLVKGMKSEFATLKMNARNLMRWTGSVKKLNRKLKTTGAAKITRLVKRGRTRSVEEKTLSARPKIRLMLSKRMLSTAMIYTGLETDIIAVIGGRQSVQPSV